MRFERKPVIRRAVEIFAFLFWCVALAAAQPARSPFSSTNIFAPASTPAKTIFGLSVFVLSVTGVIFVVVFTGGHGTWTPIFITIRGPQAH